MKNALLLLALLATLTLAARDSNAGKATASISISATVDPFAEWADTGNIIIQSDWSGPIDHVNQKQTVSHAMTLYSNADAHISAQPTLNGGILTKDSQTLDTQYRLVGTSLAAPDTTFKSTSQFFSSANTYIVPHIQGTGVYTLNLEVQMASPPNSAPDSGTYTCGIQLTAGW